MRITIRIAGRSGRANAVDLPNRRFCDGDLPHDGAQMAPTTQRGSARLPPVAAITRALVRVEAPERQARARSSGTDKSRRSARVLQTASHYEARTLAHGLYAGDSHRARRSASRRSWAHAPDHLLRKRSFGGARWPTMKPHGQDRTNCRCSEREASGTRNATARRRRRAAHQPPPRAAGARARCDRAATRGEVPEGRDARLPRADADHRRPPPRPPVTDIERKGAAGARRRRPSRTSNPTSHPPCDRRFGQQAKMRKSPTTPRRSAASVGRRTAADVLADQLEHAALTRQARISILTRSTTSTAATPQRDRRNARQRRLP